MTTDRALIGGPSWVGRSDGLQLTPTQDRHRRFRRRTPMLILEQPQSQVTRRPPATGPPAVHGWSYLGIREPCPTKTPPRSNDSPPTSVDPVITGVLAEDARGVAAAAHPPRARSDCGSPCDDRTGSPASTAGCHGGQSVDQDLDATVQSWSPGEPSVARDQRSIQHLGKHDIDGVVRRDVLS